MVGTTESLKPAEVRNLLNEWRLAQPATVVAEFDAGRRLAVTGGLKIRKTDRRGELVVNGETFYSSLWL